ncbi:MAG: PQQ-dependent sugar dehydrogenase [Actinomycetota bacterium]
MIKRDSGSLAPGINPASVWAYLRRGPQAREPLSGMCQTARLLASASEPVRFLRTFTALLFAAAALTAPASAEALSLEGVGTFESPTYVTSDPGDANRLFVVERPGRIQLTEAGNTTTFLDIESLVLSPPEPGTGNNEGGLFSMAFSPGYAADGLFYVVYRGVDDPDTGGEDESGDWHLDEFSANGDTADPASRREVLTVDYPSADLNAQLHYGGQLEFGPDGYLYASIGDGGPQGDPNGNAQDVTDLFGSILRIDPSGSSPGEYSVPSDNPFAGTAGCADGCDEIWSYGLRNPWRFSFDRETGALAIGDVGQSTWEEVDYEPVSAELGRGDNFGWNCREGAHPYPGPGEPAPVCADRVGTFTEPVFEYQHLDGNCSVTGGYVVRTLSLGDLFGRYLYADFCVGELRSLSLGLPAAGGDRSEGLSVPFVTSFGEDADCRIYVASLTGPVYRLTEPAAGAPAGCPAELPPSTSPASTLPPSNAFSFGKVKRNKRKGTATLTVIVPGPGTLVLTGKGLVKQRPSGASRAARIVAKTVSAAGKVKLKVRSKGKKKRTLNRTGKVKVKAKITYTPTGGDPNKKSKRIKLVKRL